ncbi:vascular cell adhesion protein 1 [Kryptolebias marmoratus]|uniref:vascular cell adhesion protein 1 n=1 Tax=Kryptolebias marmoratus TaxID=37003 RepID=UPI0007F90F76|nr:vascular cell adhesion protein 1 [Kryptolebias marmoratus]XP_024865561.1 vascular cell adhesion protein 1 [Kryptolebias marmoratus]XP_037833324.1 vascular cell adhesion protein 1 [Kryptolebias marmoratus]
MKLQRQSPMAALPVNVATVIVFLGAFFLSGVLAYCGNLKSGLSITAPKKIEALSGSCLQIPCSYEETHTALNTKGTIFGVWLKNTTYFHHHPNCVIFNSSKSVNTYPMDIIGNLSQKNCTTLFPNLNTSQNGKYFFRIEIGKVRVTACDHPIEITVQDSAWRPKIEISGDLKDNESVTITCSALTPCPFSPPELTWNLQQDSQRQTEKNINGTFTTKIQETFTLSDAHDGYNIICSVKYPVNEGKDLKAAEAEVTLDVSYAPKDTSASISPPGLASAGSWVNLTCSSRAKPPISSFSWFKTSKRGAIKLAEGDFYSFNLTEGGEYYCVATNDLGKGTSSVILLRTEGDQVFGISVYVVVKILGIVMLCTTVIIVECWFRFSNKPEKGRG